MSTGDSNCLKPSTMDLIDANLTIDHVARTAKPETTPDAAHEGFRLPGDRRSYRPKGAYYAYRMRGCTAAGCESV